MQKARNPVKSSRWLLLGGLLLLSPLPVPLSAGGQAAPPSTAESDAKERMLAAIKVNGLTGPDVQPWHLKASFKVLYKQSGVSDAGTFEEWWASPSKYKLVYASTVISQTEYGSENVPLLSGSRDPMPNPLSRLRRLILSPMPNERTIESRGVTPAQREIDGVAHTCIAVNRARMADIQIPPTTYCLDADDALLQSVEGLTTVSQVTFKDPVAFQGHKVARDIEVSDADTVVLTIHIESIELLSQIDDAEFQAPPDATPKQIRMVRTKIPSLGPGGTSAGGTAISAGVAQGMLVDRVTPVYPPIARAAGVSGTVILEATIGKEGKVTDVRVISGPPLLQQAALDAVQQWTYRPFMLNGEPAEVRTTVNVVFQLGQAPKPQ